MHTASGQAGAQSPRVLDWLTSRPLLLEIAALSLGVLVFLVSVVPDLADFPVPTDDEIWVMSASFKLANEGVFGSDMFSGFFHADSHYFFNMPLHHVVLAASFKLFGAGVLQARLVGVAYGLATLLLTYLIARKAYGPPAAQLSMVLLLFLRLNMGFDTGLPLQELAANMRYDLAPVPFLLAGVLVLLGGTTPRRAVVAGLLFGIAVLMQFYGAFLIPIGLAFIWWDSKPVRQRLKLSAALVGAAALVCLPYAAYALVHYDDFKGQAGTIDCRADFTRPSFYIDNLLHEPDRFVRPLAIPYAFTEVPAGQDPFLVEPQQVGAEALFRRPSAKLGVLVGVPAALLFFGWRALRLSSRTDRLLLLCLGGLVVQYALLESTKFYFYWIPVVPFLSVGVAGAALWLLRPPRGDTLRLALAGLTALALLFVLFEGSVARVNGLRTGRDAASYAALADAIHERVPEGSRVVGATSLWWGLRDTDYRSYFLFFYLTRPAAAEYASTIPGFLDGFDAQYIVLTRVAANELERHLSPRDLADWDRFLAERTTHVARLEPPVARSYGYVDIWRVE